MRYGIKSVSMDDLAHEIGISKKTIYQEVDDKAKLVTEVLNHHIQCEEQHLQEIKLKESNAISQLVGISKKVLELLRNLRPVLLYDLKKYYPETWQLMQKNFFPLIERVMEDNLRLGKRQGMYRQNLDEKVVARLYVNMAKTLNDDTIFDLDEFDRSLLFKQMMEYHIRGIISPENIKKMDWSFLD